MFMRPSLRAMFIVLLSVGLLTGLTACGKRKAEATVVASFEAPPKEVGRLAAEAAKGSSPMSDWSAGPFEVKPEGGAHLVRWTFTGEVTRAGPVEIRAFGMLESETPSGKGPGLVRCKVDKPEAAPGPATYSCDTNRFRTEDAKKMHLAPVLEKLNGFVPTRMQLEVMTVPVETSAWDWFVSMPLLGLVMVGLWWFFFRR
jgi:hypothetical protein